MEYNKSLHLQNVLETHRMRHVQSFVDKMTVKRSEITSFLKQKYGGYAYDPFNSGSMAKHTATNVKFDMDIVIPFNHNTFDTLEEMYENVFSTLEKEYRNEANIIRKQKVSVGIKFPLDKGESRPIEIDVVPGREPSQNSYLENRDLNIYIFNPYSCQQSGGMYKKTNIHKQIEYISGKNSERQIIRLLKIWKKHSDKPYKSFLIELAVIKAFEQYNGSSGLWERLKYVMNFILNNIADSSFHLYDPGNTNNDVVVDMGDYDKYSLQSDMANMLNNIENNPSSYLPYYFPLNEMYSGYAEKTNGLSFPSSPKRFG